MNIFFYGLLLSLAVFSSCGNAKKLQYLQGPIDPIKYGAVNYKEPVIQTGDILSISVFSDNPVASAIYNRPSVASSGISSGGATFSNNSASVIEGYLVDNNGNIQFHSLGVVLAKGLTKEQLAKKITDSLRNVLQNPYCLIRFTNFKITVLGEVGQPSVYSIPSEKISILEALGLAGDLNSFARRDSVMIIRETTSERKFGWIDLRKPDIFSSDYFYLQQNDVIVVHPTRNKAAANDQVVVRNISLGATLLSTLAVVFTLLTR